MINEYGFCRIGAARPLTIPSGISENTESLMSLMEEASSNYCDITVYPELAVSSYNCGELFRQQILLSSVQENLSRIAERSLKFKGIHIIGFPLAIDGQLFNCAGAVSGGQILGIVPKSYIPNNNEYYEGRWFTSGLGIKNKEVFINNSRVPFGTDIIFRNSSSTWETFGIEICEDLWSVIPPSSRLALGGASIIFNLSASTDILGKADYRSNLVRHQSAAIVGAYAYCSAGVGESTTDTVCSGHSLITENGKILIENKRFTREDDLVYADIDLEYIQHERLNNVSFSQSVIANSINNSYRSIYYESAQKSDIKLERRIDPHPFVPASSGDLDKRCSEILKIQSNGLATRMVNSKIKKTVIGLSGGLDSTLALLVIIETFKQLNLDNNDIHCFTMPGFGTSKRTRSNVDFLCAGLGLELKEINIEAASIQHFKDIGHNIDVHDTTYENTQARERTQVLMDKSNQLGALVIGTGDLSELALGWCTYNGDHMSMYSVNCGVPKTLVKFLIRYYLENIATREVSDVLSDIIDTPISPELLPPGKDGKITQKTEDTIGPYELHDFFLFNAIRCGFKPEKVLMLSKIAFDELYSEKTIRKWLKVFYERFFSQQFKRSALPDGPKVGTLALSPRGDWRMPSDASPEDWLKGI